MQNEEGFSTDIPILVILAARWQTSLAGSANRCRQIDPARTIESLGLTEPQINLLALLKEGKNNKLTGHALDLADPNMTNRLSAMLRASASAASSGNLVLAGASGNVIDSFRSGSATQRLVSHLNDRDISATVNLTRACDRQRTL